VCHKWNDILLSQRPPRFLLIMKNVFPYPAIPHELPSLERKLTKKILIDFEIYQQKGIMVKFCEKYGKDVEHLKSLKLTSRPFKDFVFILENNLCPNLASLSINLLVISFFEIIKLPIMSKLELIRLKTWNYDPMNNKKVTCV
jgi:hypothetical protein